MRRNRVSLRINEKKFDRVDLDLTQFNNNPEQLKELSHRAWIEYCVGQAKVEAKLHGKWEDEVDEICQEVAKRIAAQFGYHESI